MFSVEGVEEDVRTNRIFPMKIEALDHLKNLRKLVWIGQKPFWEQDVGLNLVKEPI